MKVILSGSVFRFRSVVAATLVPAPLSTSLFSSRTILKNNVTFRDVTTILRTHTARCKCYIFWFCGRQGEKNGTFGQQLTHCALCERGLNSRVFRVIHKLCPFICSNPLLFGRIFAEAFVRCFISEAKCFLAVCASLMTFLQSLVRATAFKESFWIVCQLALPPWSSAPGKAPRRAKKRCALFMQVVLVDHTRVT